MNVAKPALTKIDQAPQTLRDIVQDRMREAIIQGAFEPGQRLVERALCEQLGVSRTVIRETIRYLEAEGLVELMPNRGPIVATLDWDQARQIYDIRRQLETAAAMACARNGSTQMQARLETALADLKRGFASEDVGQVFKDTARFYEVIFDEAGHSVAWEIVQRLNGRISRLRAMTLSSDDRAKPGLTHMSEICAAIVSGNPKAARRAVKQHLQDASDVARRLLGAAEDNSDQTGEPHG